MRGTPASNHVPPTGNRCVLSSGGQMINHPVFLRKLWINGNVRDWTGKHAHKDDHIKGAKVWAGVASSPAPLKPSA